MEPAIVLEEIRKTYRPGILRPAVPALRGLSLAVPAGEVYALVGPNGAGKTTAFRILLGLVRADSGRGTILGAPLGDRRGRARLGYLPEAPCYYPFLSVRELLDLAARLSRVADRARAVDRALERFGLAALAHRPVKKLSKGQLQRVGIAQAAVHEPELLILDEPMSGLDPLARSEVKGWIRGWRDEGRTVLLASHMLPDVEALADRVGMLRDGAIALQGTAEELLEGSETGTEIVFRLPVDPAPLVRELPVVLREGAGIWTARVEADQELAVSALLARILARGGTVRSVLRRRRGLEEVFVDSYRTGRGEADAGSREATDRAGAAAAAASRGAAEGS
ncbi:MAG: ABC transporter ATP-binding protein [Candidatus Eisenbacteria bacterium]